MPRRNGTRARILALLDTVTALRSRTVAAALGLDIALAGVHLSQMVRAGLLVRETPPDQRYDVRYRRAV